MTVKILLNPSKKDCAIVGFAALCTTYFGYKWNQSRRLLAQALNELKEAKSENQDLETACKVLSAKNVLLSKTLAAHVSHKGKKPAEDDEEEIIYAL